MARFQFRRDTSTNWASTNPVLLPGEIGIDTTLLHFKLGDGVTAWNSLQWTAVVSVFGRTGAITAQAGDYSFDQISGACDGGSF